MNRPPIIARKVKRLQRTPTGWLVQLRNEEADLLAKRDDIDRQLRQVRASKAAAFRLKAAGQDGAITTSALLREALENEEGTL